MSNPLSGLDLKHWWTVTIALGVLILLGAMAAKRDEIMLLGFGMALFGLGEMISHPLQTTIIPGRMITGYPRRFRVLGLLCDAIGLAAIGRGAWLFLQHLD